MNLKRFAMRALYAALATGGLTLLGAGVAHASETGGDDGILSGTQAIVSIAVPVTISGNGISILGDSSSADAATEAPPAAAPAAAPAAEATTSGDDSLLGGLQGLIDVTLPVTVGGNAISVAGDSSSTDAANTVDTSGTADAEGSASTSGDDGILGGTQAVVDAVVPVTVGGNAISVIGDSESTEAATDVAASGGTGSSAGASTSGDDSLLGGTQAIVDAAIPVAVGGNAISVIGDSSSTDAATEVAPGTGGGSATTDGHGGLLGGTQLIPALSLPITVGGNAVSVVGDSITDGPSMVVVPGDPGDPGAPGTPGDPGDPGTPGEPGTPGTPGEPGTPGTPGTDGSNGAGGSTGSDGSTGSATTIASTTVTSIAGSSGSGTLASTGAETGLLPSAGLLLALGLVLVGMRRFALRR